jgi:hypothetical protein
MAFLDDYLTDLSEIGDILKKIELASKSFATFNRKQFGEGDPRAHTFVETHNTARISSELIGMYGRVCQSPQFRGEWEQEEEIPAAYRAFEPGRSLFIRFMSIVEYDLKRIILLTKDKALLSTLEKNKMLPFSQLRNLSLKNGILSNEDAEKWRLASKIRNIIVHNGMISDDSFQVTLPTRTVIFEAGVQPRFEVDFFYLMTESLLAPGYRWYLKIGARS